jgi:hypothetical protein
MRSAPRAQSSACCAKTLKPGASIIRTATASATAPANVGRWPRFSPTVRLSSPDATAGRRGLRWHRRGATRRSSRAERPSASPYAGGRWCNLGKASAREGLGEPVFEILGIAGITISMVAYVPQVSPPREGTLLRGHQPSRVGECGSWAACSSALCRPSRGPRVHRAPIQHADLRRDHLVPGAEVLSVRAVAREHDAGAERAAVDELQLPDVDRVFEQSRAAP